MSNEIWKEIFDGYYAVSNKGRVKRLKFHRNGCENTFLKPLVTEKGYIRFSISHRNSRLFKKAHILVAEAFIGPKPSMSHEINHKNGVKDDNRAENLEWVTHRENIAHSYRLGLSKGTKGEQHATSKLKEKDVLKIRNLYPAKNFREIAYMFGVSRHQVSHIVRREQWTHI